MAHVRNSKNLIPYGHFKRHQFYAHNARLPVRNPEQTKAIAFHLEMSEREKMEGQTNFWANSKTKSKNSLKAIKKTPNAPFESANKLMAKVNLLPFVTHKMTFEMQQKANRIMSLCISFDKIDFTRTTACCVHMLRMLWLLLDLKMRKSSLATRERNQHFLIF